MLLSVTDILEDEMSLCEVGVTISLKKNVTFCFSAPQQTSLVIFI